jgi:hypothetical protein
LVGLAALVDGLRSQPMRDGHVKRTMPQADRLRAAAVERAHYHTDLARRRYLAVDPANRLVADTLEADYNTALRGLRDAQDAYQAATNTAAGTPTEQQTARIRLWGSKTPLHGLSCGSMRLAGTR